MEKLEIEFSISEITGAHVASAKYKDRWHSGAGESFDEAEKRLVKNMKEYYKALADNPLPKNKIIEIEL